ncbi:universal stress protein [Metapseudomonas resinovorans]|uniref:universal stress protein n=1 Tax=Metapseudomonas resinovorans TaxID=53412 RepID=UPI000420EAEB|nr:universal stress protein [Pseudomonas resinovorans]
MSVYHRLLLILAPGPGPSSALNRAAALAEASGAAIHIVTCGSPYAALWLMDRVVQERLHVEFIKSQESRLREVAEQLRARGIQATTEVLWTEDPLDELLRHVEELPADLVIKDTFREPALQRAFMTPLDWQLLRECPVPLHLVSFAEHPLPWKVAAAVDLSTPAGEMDPLDERILAAARDLALQCNAELHLLHAYEHSSGYPVYGTDTLEWPSARERELNRQRRASFDALADRFGVPNDRRHLVLGTPLRVIADFTRQAGMDVVVMGTLTHKGLEKVLGSTTEHALYQVASSIFAIRPPVER